MNVESVQSIQQSIEQPIQQSANQPIQQTISSVQRRNRSATQKFILLSIAVAFFALSISLLFTSPSANHPCPYADVLGLESSSQSIKPSEMPPAHVIMPGMTEEDCPHLRAAQRNAQAAQRENSIKLAATDVE